ncbi:Glu-tRNA(Gln) amidotransferase subunit GatE [Halocatena marina]|uniref:Glutamyl-tRNA(Gln) amidotransferase subunit E n=1 Tax=Halocatena marina TaxID=2934937 RepID=A0ABD5YNS9_9EURY|nr:Glu-tRNA(Gln) amidotransferase subunit GatE [Halocatena marina]
MTAYDYEEVGLMSGLEIHQQLDTATKLFCECPTVRREPANATRQITRYLHPTRSELGEIDEAALEESRIEREFTYLGYDTTCLVEEDDEPPHRIDEEALSVALEIAKLLDMNPVDQAHIMRKIVVDGSNTSGFQRSTLIATDGQIETDDGPVTITDLLIEEESCQRVEETDAGVTYSLDRLGIPLVEIGTGPDLRTPEQAQEAAATIGMLLRSTGAVKRGLGTIRQDVNVSIEDGARVELKGVQSLDDIAAIVENEVKRQVHLIEISETLQERSASVGDPVDVTGVFEDTDSGVIASANAVRAVPLFGFDGLVGREIQSDRRLGTEFSDHAVRSGAGGVFHTDELPAYGVTQDEVDALREAVGASEDDAVALVAAPESISTQAIEAVAERARDAITGVPEETRGANPDTTSEYLRPLPGAARMYPETDVSPVSIDPSDVQTPELLTEKRERYVSDLDLDSTLAEQVAYGRWMPVFERAVEQEIDPTLAARTLEGTITELRRDDVPVETLREEHLIETLELVTQDELAKEGVTDVLTVLANEPDLTADQAVDEAGLSGVDDETVRTTIAEIAERNEGQIREEGMGAFSALMGECMGALRGKADGELVSSILREEIQKRT